MLFHALSLTRLKRSIMGVLWITGLSGSGKTTLARKIISLDQERRWIHLDGDELRKILPNGEKYDKSSRLILAAQYSNLANLISGQNHNVVVSTISLFNEIHEFNREIISNYIEVYIDTPLDKLKKRDDKEIYSKFSSENLVGLNISFDIPRNANLILKQDFDMTSLVKNAIDVISIIPSYWPKF